MILIDDDLKAELKSGATPHRLPALRALSDYLAAAQKAVGIRGELTALLTTDARQKALNKNFRRKNKTTDVLSFPAEPIPGLKPSQQYAGDLSISVPVAAAQAAEHSHTLAIELKVLLLHGLLHLSGLDHETDQGQMAKRELQLRTRLELPGGLIERTERGLMLGKKAPAKPAKPTAAKATTKSPNKTTAKNSPNKTASTKSTPKSTNKKLSKTTKAANKKIEISGARP